LAAIYEKNKPLAHVSIEFVAMKNVAMTKFRTQYEQLKASWAASPGMGAGQIAAYDAWVAGANNAAFGAQAAYDDLVPDFEALFTRLAAEPGDPWPRFYDAVRQLAGMPAAQRISVLKSGGPRQP
jgi:predicted aminopeptidase